MVKARKYILLKHFSGEPKRSDVKIVEEELPALEDGEFLCKAEFISVDPYMRIYMDSYPVGTQMIGTQVARVIESKNNSYPVGKLVVGNYGWRDYSLDGGKYEKKDFAIVPTYVLPDIGNLPPSLGIGILGMPGNTAYFGFLEICQPKEGDVVVVTGAAGAVGSVVGQIAKIKGCTVIGFAGSDSKCKWLKDNLGFDFAFNYKTVNAMQALKEAAPNGIDCFFDNVGGELSATVMAQMKTFGKVSICGSISTYNDDVTKVSKGCTVIGFAGSDSKCKWLKDNLGFDFAFNYKTVNAMQALKEAAPNGIDCFFDNVGGELSATVMAQMKTFGKVSICGSISTYNDDVTKVSKGPMIQALILHHELRVEGFHVNRWADRWQEGIQQLRRWIEEGKLKYEETYTEGFENMFDGFVGMLRGQNTGKAVIKV